MPLSRRLFITRIASIASAIALLPSALLASWPKSAFITTERQQVLTELFGEQLIEPSELIQIQLDKRVESGDRVTIEVSTSLEKVESISLLLDNNPHPLAANIRFEEIATPFLATRLRLHGSSEITAIIKTADGLYSHQKSIRVLVSGCSL